LILDDKILELSDIKYDIDKLLACYMDIKKAHTATATTFLADGHALTIYKHSVFGNEYKEINELMNIFNPSFINRVAIFEHSPYAAFHPHVDEPHRASVIMIPIINGVGTDFYDNSIITDEDPDAMYKHVDELCNGTYVYSSISPTLMNPQTAHGIRNDNNMRVMLQLTSEHITFAECKEMIKAGEFFNKDK